MGISNDNFFKNFILGVTNECIKIDSRTYNRDAVTKLLHSARDQIAIVSRHLDPTIYNNEEISNAATQLVRRARHTVNVFHQRSRFVQFVMIIHNTTKASWSQTTLVLFIT